MPVNYYSYREVLEDWKCKLAGLYDDSEIRSIFRIALEDILGVDNALFRLHSDGELSQAQNFQLKEVLERLKTAEPIQYIAGFTFFDGLKLNVSPDVLIPRPETEELVHWVISGSPGARFILDVCTGSGCIAIALKNHFPSAVVTASDISESSLEIARKNAKENRLDVNFVHDNALDSKIGGIFDVIVSNPPYIPVSERKDMHSNVVQFEPGLALFVSDEDPLVFYRAIAHFASGHLVGGGALYFELHEKYAGETEEMVKNTGYFHSVEVKTDLQGKSRMLKAIKN